MSRFAECLEHVLKHEGGWSNHPKDPGGATNFGITIGTYRNTLNPKATKDDLKHISKADVQAIYKKHYWDPIDGDGLGPGVDLAVFDFAVNSGVSRAKRYFRSVMDDHRKRDSRLINRLCDNRMVFLRGLSVWPTFKNGWTRRVAEVREQSLMDVGKPVESVTTPKVPETPEVSSSWLSVLISALWKAFKR